jgi:hypothetical protein
MYLYFYVYKWSCKQCYVTVLLTTWFISQLLKSNIDYIIYIYIYNTVEPRFTNLIRSWRPFVTRNVRKPKLLWSHGVLFNNSLYIKNTMKFKRRHGEFVQGCVLSESYTATNALPLILPACRHPLLPACLSVTRDTVRQPRCFLSGKSFRVFYGW